MPLALLDVLRNKGGWQSLKVFFGPDPNAISDLRLANPVPHLAEALYIARRQLRPCRR